MMKSDNDDEQDNSLKTITYTKQLERRIQYWLEIRNISMRLASFFGDKDAEKIADMAEARILNFMSNKSVIIGTLESLSYKKTEREEKDE